MAQVIRKLRHWRQRFDPKATFVFRRRTKWSGEWMEPGDPVPDGVSTAKLRNMWDARRIELAEIEEPAPTGSNPEEPPPEAPLPDFVEQRGSWFAVAMPDGSERRVQGREALDKLLAELGDPNAPSNPSDSEVL